MTGIQSGTDTHIMEKACSLAFSLAHGLLAFFFFIEKKNHTI